MRLRAWRQERLGDSGRSRLALSLIGRFILVERCNAFAAVGFTMTAVFAVSPMTASAAAAASPATASAIMAFVATRSIVVRGAMAIVFSLAALVMAEALLNWGVSNVFSLRLVLGVAGLLAVR